jgi:hypothetical protein
LAKDLGGERRLRGRRPLDAIRGAERAGMAAQNREVAIVRIGHFETARS